MNASGSMRLSLLACQGEFRFGESEHLAQRSHALGLDLIRGPGEALDMRRHSLCDRSEMLSSARAVDDHGNEILSPI